MIAIQVDHILMPLLFCTLTTIMHHFAESKFIELDLQGTWDRGQIGRVGFIAIKPIRLNY
jgi:hypothetical protein